MTGQPVETGKQQEPRYQWSEDDQMIVDMRDAVEEDGVLLGREVIPLDELNALESSLSAERKRAEEAEATVVALNKAYDTLAEDRADWMDRCDEFVERATAAEAQVEALKLALPTLAKFVRWGMPTEPSHYMHPQYGCTQSCIEYAEGQALIHALDALTTQPRPPEADKQQPTGSPSATDKTEGAA